nr:hypothetical protein [Tanacetum cinerariifolium]
MKNVLKDNDRLLENTISVDIVNTVVHDHVNSADKTMNRNNSFSQQSAPTFDQLFEINDLKAQSQGKDTVIVKLKERLKSLSGNVQDGKIKRELKETETINTELDHRVTKLVAENEHLKQTYKQLYDSIKSLRVQSKEQCDDAIKQVNLKSTEVSDLNTSLQEKFLVITALKETLSKLKGKAVVNEAVPLHSIEPELLKICVAPLAPNLHNNRTAHTDYLRHTQVETATLREIVESNTKNDRIQRAPSKVKTNKLEDHHRTVRPSLNKKTSAVDTKAISSVTNSKLNTPAALSIQPEIALSSSTLNRNFLVVQIVLWYLDSGCSKYTTGDRSQLINFEQKFLGTVKFRNDHVAKIMGYGDYKIGNVTILRVYFVEGNNLYTLSLQDMMASSPICLLSKASKTKSWLWHHRLSHLNFGAVNHLARQGLVRGLPKLKFEKDHLCSVYAMGKKSVNGKKYILVIVDDYSRFTWVKFLRSKDEAPDFIIKFLKMIQVRLKISVRRIRTDNRTEFVNQMLREYYEEVGISHETSVAYSPQQNGVVERRNRTLIEEARTIENLGKLQPKADIGNFIGYAPTKKAFRIYNRRTRRIVETIHVDFDELTAMASEQSSLGPVLNEMTSTTISSGLVQKSSSSTPYVPPSRNDWDLLFQPMFDELLNLPPSVDHQAPKVIALIDDALVDAYESDKIILDTYGETITLKRRRDDDVDKDEESSAGLDRGSKRHREGKEPESTSAPMETATRSTGRLPLRWKSPHIRSLTQKPPSLDRAWNKTVTAVYGSIQPWISELAKKVDTRSYFNELMDAPLDFSNFLINRLKEDTLTPELLAGPTYELMKDSCKSLIELEYHLEEVFKATTDQLDWVNPEGQQGASSRKYTTSITKTKAADYGHIKWIEDLFYGFAVNRESAHDVYSKRRIIDVTKLKIVEWYSCKHLDWITVRRDDDKLYKFMEGNFKRLHIQDIEDMLLLLVQGKLTNITVEERFAFNVSLRIFTRSIVIQRHVEDLQLGVESYQKKLNLTKPDLYRYDLKCKEAYTTYSNPRGFIYQNKDKRNRLMRIDELHKFSDGTLNDVRTALDDCLKGIWM